MGWNGFDMHTPVMMRIGAWRLLLATAWLWAGLAHAGAQADPNTHANEATWALLKQGGQVVLVRHALTEPGVGDPPDFVLGDCQTQRNLSDAGRQEARRLGAAFRSRGIPIARVLSSPWCRCTETAKLAFGSAETSAALGNLFYQPQNRERQVAAFRALVAKAPRKPGNLILVTHGSTVLAFTGVSPATAEMVVVTPSLDGPLQVAGRIAVADAASPSTSAEGRTK